MEKLLKTSRRLFLPVSILTTCPFKSKTVRSVKLTQTYRIARDATDSLRCISMTAAEHEILERQQYRLDAQQHRVHKADGVDRVKRKALEETDILRR